MTDSVAAVEDGRHVRSMTVVRHGQTSYNANHRMQGQIDIPLNSVGRWQVERTAEELRAEYVDGAPQDRHLLVVSSDLGRAAATAHAFADPLGQTVHLDPGLRERSFGEWEGASAEEVRQRWPEDYESWSRGAGGELLHGAETKAQVGKRGLETLNRWIHRAGPDTDLMVFSHGSFIAQALQALLGMASEYPEYLGLVTMRNAHWARLMPRDLPDGGLRWSMIDYNRGPAIAMRGDWDNPRGLVQTD